MADTSPAPTRPQYSFSNRETDAKCTLCSATEPYFRNSAEPMTFGDSISITSLSQRGNLLVKCSLIGKAIWGRYVLGFVLGSKGSFAETLRGELGYDKFHAGPSTGGIPHRYSRRVIGSRLCSQSSQWGSLPQFPRCKDHSYAARCRSDYRHQPHRPFDHRSAGDRSDCGRLLLVQGGGHPLNARSYFARQSTQSTRFD